ncbi:DUF5960 family protein [Fundicoccus sp. Sow4_D5]|uniref:DUF5960 family protein n=1 Tax=Fundicoccus sp. Sow4_D5 TaxID=3438782 RepID=UPI003F9373D4
MIFYNYYHQLERDFNRYSSMSEPFNFLTNNILKSMVRSQTNYFVLNRQHTVD